MVLTFVFAGLSDLETAAEFAKLLSSNHTLWAGRPGSSEPGAGCLWHRALGFSQASSTRFCPLLPPPPRSQRPAPGFRAAWRPGQRVVEGLAGAPVTQEWTGVTSGPGVSRSHLGPMGPAQQPGVLGAAPMPAGRLPCGRGALRCVSGPNDPWRHGPSRRLPCKLTGGVTVRWAPKGNPSCEAPREFSIPGGPRGARPPLPASGTCLASEWIPHQTLTPSVGDAAGMSERSCGRRRRSGSGPQIPAGRGGWPSAGKRASAPPTAGARGRPPPFRTGSRAVRGDARCASAATQEPGRSAGSGHAPHEGGARVLSGPTCSLFAHWATGEANQTRT